MATLLKPASVRDRVSPEEWALRQDLACAFRMIAHLGWDDLNYTHISLRVPGEPFAFLMNGFDEGFEEVTASSLLKVDADGRLLIENDRMANPAGFTIHSAIQLGREDARAVIHLHTVAGAAVSMMACGLLAASQPAASVMGELCYHDYEGIAVDLAERERLVRDLGASFVMLLRNHGTLAVGRTIGEAFLRIYTLERACQMQVAALAAGREGLLLPSEEAVTSAARTTAAISDMAANRLTWPLVRRRMERLDAGFLN